MDKLEIARQYVSKSFSVIPVPFKSKQPIIKWTEFQNRLPEDNELVKWFGNGSKNNIGIVTGKISGICVVDLDSNKAVEFWKSQGFPPTPLVKTGKGFHLYYRYKDGVRNFQKRDDLPDIDLRGDGGQVIAPPSTHPSGIQYQWVKGKGLDDIPLAELPEIILIKNNENKTPIKELYKGTEEGQRNDSLARLSGSWVNDKLTFEECLENAFLWNSKNTSPLPEKEVTRTVKSIYEKHHREKNTISGVNDVIDVNVTDRKIIQPIPFPFHIFPEKIRTFISHISESFSIQPELTSGLVLAILSGCIGNTVRVSVKSGYEVIPFLWLMIIGRSGYGKSPVMNFLVGPIEKRQAIDSAKYEDDLRGYLRELRTAKDSPGIDIEKPKAIHKLVSDITVEALADVFQGDQRGVIGHHDELASFMLGMDQYRAKGNDLQHYLSLFYGKSWKIDRKSRTSFIQNTGLALIGGIQSEILPRIFETFTIKNGLFPRFLTLNVEERPSKFNRNGISEGEIWDSIISKCYDIPLEHDEQGFVKPRLLTLDSSSLDLWIAFHDEYASLIPYLSNRFAPFCEKLKGYYSLKFAGLLHVLKCLDRGTVFDHEIESDTVSGAIELTRYFAGQSLMTLNLYDESHRLNEFQIKLIKTLNRLKGEVSGGRLLFSRIVKIFNDDLPEALRHTPEKIAGLLKNFGLKTDHGAKNLVYLVWEEDRTKSLFSQITLTPITTLTQRDEKSAQRVNEVNEVNVESENKIPDEEIEIIDLEHEKHLEIVE